MIRDTFSTVVRAGWRSAFSLIEVLIGIVVLALGLVGLAAVFPTVVRQQQTAADVSQGHSVAQSAIVTLRQHAELSRPASDAGISPSGFGPLNLVGWSVLTWDPAWSMDGSWDRSVVRTDALTGQSTIGQRSGSPTFAQLGKYNLGAGMDLPVQDPRNIRLGGVIIELRDRLFPLPLPGVAGAAQPRYVWDFATRRVDMGVPHRMNDAPSFYDDGVQVVVFVRRIDSGIRKPRGQELSDLFAPYGSDPVLLPVAVDANGVPTLDGGSNGALNYSTISRIEFGLDPREPDRIKLIAPAALLPYAAQVGQKYVDQMGVVYKVEEVIQASGGDYAVRLDRAFPLDYEAVAPQPSGVLELLFTPQVPAAVEVFTTMPSASGGV
jgi:type II secretory pathway pseudopilin PulG